SVKSHENFIQCFGISQKPGTREYIMVLQYPDEGNLREYLQKNANRLDWNDKISIGLQIATGLKFMHDHNKVHGAL
ncbi:14086_t:CDS:2, partial [Acaulospora morrowiae]